jgi:flavin-dependent dehydrogenase
MEYDVAIAGGGPAGLATAIATAQMGLRPIVLERKSEPVDKVCGEGLLPPAIEALERLGVRRLIDPAQCFPFPEIQFINEDGSFAQGDLPRGGGLGVRRTGLISALITRATQLEVEVRDRCAVVGFDRDEQFVTVETTGGSVKAKMLVAADGARSPIRRLAGLQATTRGPRRFGMRRHFAVAPWSSCVEVYFATGVEAYVTPLGQKLVGVAFLWEDDSARREVCFGNFMSRFPALAERLSGAEVRSEVRGAGPMSQRSRAWIAPRLALVGDAGGYVDAITGEGLSLAFGGAVALARVLPRAISSGATAAALAPYQRSAARNFRHSALPTHLMLKLARRPRLRRAVIQGLGRHPRLFEFIIKVSTLLPVMADGREPNALVERLLHWG